MKLPPRSNRLYLVIKELLTEKAELRDSDKKLLWAVWEKEGHVIGGRLTYADWLSTSLTTAETVTRTRRKLQERLDEFDYDNYVEKLINDKNIKKIIDDMINHRMSEFVTDHIMLKIKKYIPTVDYWMDKEVKELVDKIVKKV